MTKTNVLIRNVALANDKSELQWNITRGKDSLLVDPFPDGIGWCVMKNDQYVGDITPVNPAENHKVTPLQVRLIRDEVQKPLAQSEVTTNSVIAIADNPAMAVGFVKRML